MAADFREGAERSLDDAQGQLTAAELKSADMAPRRERLALIDDALGTQTRRAVEEPAPYLVTALGPRPKQGTRALDEWDERALNVETYRHTELGLDPEAGALAATGVEAAIGPRPEDYAQQLRWDHAAEPAELALQLGREIDGLGLGF